MEKRAWHIEWINEQNSCSSDYNDQGWKLEEGADKLQ